MKLAASIVLLVLAGTARAGGDKPVAYAVKDADVFDGAGHPIGKADLADQAAPVLAETDGRVQLAFDGPDARVAVWVDATQPVITRAVALAATATAAAPKPGGEGVFLDPGATVEVLGHEGARAQVRTRGEVSVIGWIPANAIGARAVLGPPQPGTVRYVDAGTRVLSRSGALIATATEGTYAEDLGPHRVQLIAGYVRVVGATLGDPIAAADDGNGEEGGVVSGVVGGVAPPAKEIVPEGTCLYSAEGVAIGEVARHDGDLGSAFEIDASDPKAKTVRTTILLFGLAWSLPVYLHRGDRGGWASCR